MRHSPRGYKRTDRISDQIQKLLAVLLQRELKDPRVGMATISEVRVAKDLSFADVYVTFMSKESDEEVAEALGALAHASGFLRTQLSRELRLRVTPRLRFHYDKVLLSAARISGLLNNALSGEDPMALSRESGTKEQERSGE